MSIAVSLFRWLQGAEFYRELHDQAFSFVPSNGYSTWWDVGCGPGVLTRLAAANGYESHGFDLDPNMIAAARRLAHDSHSSAKFDSANAMQLPANSADVVSASSLLAVLPDKHGALSALWRLVRANGCLLIIEPSENMSLRNALKLIFSGKIKHRRAALLLWSFVRQGNSVSNQIQTWCPDQYIEVTRHNLLEGMVHCWICIKAP